MFNRLNVICAGVILVFSLFCITVLSFLALSSPPASATVTTTTVNISESCTMTSINNTAHTATLMNGTYSGTDYATGIGSTTLKTFCNDNAGYAIYAIGYTNDTYGNTKLHWNKAESTSDTTNDINTGIYTSGSTINSTWSMKLASVNGTYITTITDGTNNTENFTTWHVIPEAYTLVAYNTSNTDMEVNGSGEGSSVTVTYDSYISAGQPAGAYMGKVKYTLVHPSNHSTPVVYNTNADSISEVTYLQEFAKVGDANRESIINSMVEGTQYTLTDSRDNKTYTIAKLADENVWMTKNLDLDLDSTRIYTNEDTDIGYNTTTGEYETASWTPARSTYATTSTQTHEWCVGGIANPQYGYCESNFTPESYDPGDLYWNLEISDYWDWEAYYDTCDDFSSVPVCDQSLNPISDYTNATGIQQYHLGNYYNWTAAVAMNNSSSYYTYDVIVEQSICPAGWTLPRTGFGDDSFQALWEEYGFDGVSFPDNSTAWNSPLYYIMSGAFDRELGSVGYTGGLWSPVLNSADYARFADIRLPDPSNSSSKPSGFPIRCIARPVSDSVNSGGIGFLPSSLGLL